MTPDWDKLHAEALTAMQRAYAPYSRYRVGAAALTTDGRLFTGCNVENAGYGVTLCAECGLVSSLINGGGGRLAAFTCVGGDGRTVVPCGRCRQLLWEHGGPDLLVKLPNGIRTMAEVLPDAFDVQDLKEGTPPLEEDL